jgi:hypothetical protein
MRIFFIFFPHQVWGAKTQAPGQGTPNWPNLLRAAHLGVRFVRPRPTPANGARSTSIPRTRAATGLVICAGRSLLAGRAVYTQQHAGLAAKRLQRRGPAQGLSSKYTRCFEAGAVNSHTRLLLCNSGCGQRRREDKGGWGPTRTGGCGCRRRRTRHKGRRVGGQPPPASGLQDA